MGKKERHHFLPRFYLEGFIDPNNKPYLWVYEKGNPDIVKASPVDVAVQKHYYSITTEKGMRDSETFEDFFATLESDVAPLFVKLENKQSLNDDERKLVSLFLAFMMTRVPNFRNNIEETHSEIVKQVTMWLAKDPKRFQSIMEKYGKDAGDKINFPIDAIREFVLDDSRYTVKTKPEFSLFMIMELSRSFAKVFYDMKWTFFPATDEYKFLTSDNPLFRLDPTYDPKSPYGVGLRNKNIEVTFPISRNMALLAGWNTIKERYSKTNSSMVRNINKRSIGSALQYVYASEKSDTLNKLIQKFKNSAPRMEVRSPKDETIEPYIIKTYFH